MKRKVHHYVSIDVDEVLDEISTEDLIAILEERGYVVTPKGEALTSHPASEDIAWRLSRGEIREALLLLSRTHKDYRDFARWA